MGVRPSEARELATSAHARDAKVQEQLERALATFGGDLPDDREELVAQAQYFLGMGAIAGIEAGRRLAVLKQGCEHGEWHALLDRMNIGARTANNWIRIAERFYAQKQLHRLGTGKLTALLEFGEEEIVEADGEVFIAGQGVDAIDAMSIRELRQQARKNRRKQDKLKQQMEKQSEQLKDAEAYIAELEKGPRSSEFLNRLTEVQAGLHGYACVLESLAEKARNDRTALAAIVGAGGFAVRRILMAQEAVCTQAGIEEGTPLSVATEVANLLAIDLTSEEGRAAVGGALGLYPQADEDTDG